MNYSPVLRRPVVAGCDRTLDWAITAPSSWQNDMQKVAIAQDGQKEAMEHAGRTGALPFVGDRMVSQRY